MKNKIFIISQPELFTAVGGSCNINFSLCDLLISKGYEVTDILFSDVDTEHSKFNQSVKFVNLYDKNKSFDEAFEEFVKNNIPDLIIFFFSIHYQQLNTNKKYRHIPKILMFHSRPDYYFETNDINILKEENYDNNTVAQILFPSYFDLLPNFIKQNKVVFIPNYARQQNKIDSDIENKKIVYLSRLDKFKQQDFLIKAFKKISSKIPDWQLDIYGQANEDFYEYLFKIIKRNKLSEQVHLKGVTANPIKTLMQYDFCVFPSCFEGFPMGLIEAQSVGLPSIGLKKASGVNELIINNYNGLLTEYNIISFAEAIHKMAKDKELRKSFSNNTYESVKQYSKENWDNSWISLIDSIINNKSIIECEKTNKKELFTIKQILKISKEYYNPIIEKIFYYKNTKKVFILHLLGIKIKKNKKR